MLVLKLQAVVVYIYIYAITKYFHVLVNTTPRIGSTIISYCEHLGPSGLVYVILASV
jgi:hypothetical protein